MKYFEVKFTITCPDSGMMQDACDLLAALAGEAGFETFEETNDGLTGYVQQPLFERDVLDAALSDFPMPGVAIVYDVSEAEDKDWNEQWEQEGFDPIVVERAGRTVIIHDGRHQPDAAAVSPAATLIEIDARQAFGTGTHETTRMMVAALMETFTAADALPASTLDCGTGTGILSIAALKLGASRAVGYDIDEWSVDNARHNAVINGVDQRFTPLLGDATVLDGCDETFDVVLANINRNILLNDMPRFRQHMHAGSTLLLSGFYVSDGPLLKEKAESLGLRLTAERNEGEWCCMQFTTAASRATAVSDAH